MKNENIGTSRSELLERMQAMARGRKIMLVVFIIWAVQANTKWSAATLPNGDTSAATMSYFAPPRS